MAELLLNVIVFVHDDMDSTEKADVALEVAAILDNFYEVEVSLNG